MFMNSDASGSKLLSIDVGCIFSSDLSHHEIRFLLLMLLYTVLYFRSLMLLLQSALPVALFSSSQCDLHLGGGTNAEMAPPVDYFLHVFSPIAKKMGVETECFVDKR